MIRIEHVINSAKVFLRIFVKIVQHEEAQINEGFINHPRVSPRVWGYLLFSEKIAKWSSCM